MPNTVNYPGLSGQLGNEDPLYIKLTYRSAQPASLRAEGSLHGKTVPGAIGEVVQPPAGAGEALLATAYRASVKIDAIKITVFDDRYRALTSTEAPADLSWTTAPRRDPGGYAEWVIPLKQIQDQSARWQALTNPNTWFAMAMMFCVPAYPSCSSGSAMLGPVVGAGPRSCHWFSRCRP